MSIAIDNIFIFLERLLELFTSLTIVIIFTIFAKVECFFLLSNKFYEIFQIFCELFEVIISLFLRVIKLFEDQVFDERVYIRLTEERVSETR